ncbi:conserved Plasmodium protein, unknown function [Plasmodium chabaudi chabaudi]|uniref:GRAM domain-containing protein n=1 Tax=Plasmodium chabaudi chabaudi TaxID=31271 RepID=A0A1C6W8W2_PLACU|nr:conserved Plasmodium protein, unknown function [Plasmodium chabaudi chabaudi]SCL82410.1 conserved Plasmodium protein, unknown function [Plasmodium chabaudi chabaudi]VTZ69941.1 conserved Plasmodium protein, unknown function [Plasmodium chabaudi chabaudi]
MASLNETKQYHDFATEVEESPLFTNSHQNSELILDDNDEYIGYHKIFEINIKDDNENITIGMNELCQSATEPSDDESVSDDIPDANINQEIINYVYENLLPKGTNNESSSNNLGPNDKVAKYLRATSKKEELDGNDQQKASSSETVEETHEGNRAIIKTDECKLSLKSPVLVEGKCFISSDTIYFVSEFNQILKNSSIVRVKYDTLLLSKYAQELNIIPKWLKINPDENQLFSFTSLLDKDDIHNSISDMIKYAIDSKQKLETNTTPCDKTQMISQNNKLNSNDITSSLELSEKVLIIKDMDDMISMNLYPEEIKLLEENDFYSDLKYANSLYINKNFKDVYYNVFSKITEKNPYYEFYKRLDPQGVNYDEFNELGDTIQIPSGHSFNFKYNISLTKAKRKVYGIFTIPTRSDISETIKLFFFDSCIVLQTQISFVSMLPILKSFRAVITVILHDVPSEDGSGKNGTQIDMRYGVYFFEFSFFKGYITNNLLPLLEITCSKFKICLNECIWDIYKSKALRESGIEISNINNIFRTSNSSGPSSCITNNEQSRHSDPQNRTLDGFKNQIKKSQNNETIINTKHIKNIVGNYINEAMQVNPMVTPSDKTPKFASSSIIILMYIYMNFIQSLRNSS